jgi:hypothetical protein
MRQQRLRHCVCLCAVVAAVLVGGCAEKADVTYAPVTPAERAEFGSVAVLPVQRYSQSFEAETPVKGAGRGALLGAGQGILVDPILIFGSVIGAGVGAIKAHSREEVEAADAALRHAFADMRPDRMLAERVGRTAAEAGLAHRVRMVAWDVFQDELIASGVDSVLAPAVADMRLISRDQFDPAVTLVFGVHARVLRTADRVELWSQDYAYRSEEASFFDLARDDARALHDEVDKALQGIAAAVVDDVFLRSVPETRPGVDSLDDLPRGEAQRVESLASIRPPPSQRWWTRWRWGGGGFGSFGSIEFK